MSKADKSNRPFAKNDCPYCGEDIYRNRTEETSPNQHTHRARVVRQFTCGHCEWRFERVDERCVRGTARFDGPKTHLGIRERIPEGYAVIIEEISEPGRTMHNIIARVDASDEVSDEHGELLENEDVYVYTGDFDGVAA